MRRAISRDPQPAAAECQNRWLSAVMIGGFSRFLQIAIDLVEQAHHARVRPLSQQALIAQRSPARGRDAAVVTLCSREP
jgi:hypothetical protein